jgi:TPR repeat protein
MNVFLHPRLCFPFLALWTCVATAQEVDCQATDYLEQGYKVVDTEREHQINRFFAVACDCGNLEACANLAFSYAHGLYLDADSKKAEELWQKSCDGGYTEGCRQLEQFRSESKGGKTGK